MQRMRWRLRLFVECARTLYSCQCACLLTVLVAGPNAARLHTALRYAAGDTELAVQAKRTGLLPGESRLSCTHASGLQQPFITV